MVMRTLCAGFIWTTITARLNKNIGPLRFYAYIAEKSHTKNVMYFVTFCDFVFWGACHLYDYVTGFQ